MTLGTTFPDVCVSVWVLWCPILNYGANFLHSHSADRLKTCEGEQVSIMSNTNDDKSPGENCCVFPYLWKDNQGEKKEKRKKDKRFKTVFLSWGACAHLWRQYMLCPLDLCHLLPPPLSYDSAEYISFWRGGLDPRQILETGITDTYIYSSIARGEWGSHRSSSSCWAQKNPKLQTTQNKWSLFIFPMSSWRWMLNRSEVAGWEEANTCVPRWGPS